MLISIDHGNKQVKTIHHAPFTSGLICSEVRPFGGETLTYGKADIGFSFGAVLQFRALRDQPDETRLCHNTPFCHRHEYLYKKCRQRHLPLAGKYHATSTQIQT